ncbi:hypothetical protein [Neogemmobacter tilapiae]|uniref:Uncharacterized protein n=1 Tax=Neogemmobacter tilapiae TaxID=875041 RepID=A0A918WG06_9RHOB|nr:hypothetical protein [Gemmobacter tilapiae]GHC43199.1 hypothetical protein GCM10007315_00180 [Gemmobacter tilapiae]
MIGRFIFLGAVMAPLPALADYNNLTCAMTLQACDMARDTDGSCPTGSEATAQIYAEGENWYLATKGIGPGGGDRLLELKTHMTEPQRVYVIFDHEGLDGGFSHTPEGAAKLTLASLQETYLHEEYWTGTCQSPG